MQRILKTGFQIAYPWWFLIFCLGLGLAYALLLYYKKAPNTGNVKNDSIWQFVLGLLRTIIATTLAFLLLTPVFKHFTQKIEKPIILVAQDNSYSLALAMSESERQSYNIALQNLIEKLKDKCEVKYFGFGNTLTNGDSLLYAEPATDIGMVYEELYNRFEGQNVAAILLGSDGIYNQGSNPLYFKKWNIPTYSIALGDTTPKRDVKINQVYYNKIAYLGDKSAVNVELFAQFCNGKSSTLNLQQIDGGGKILSQQQVSINQDAFRFTVPYTIEASSPGVHHYRVSTSTIEGELTTENNSKDFYIEVIEEKQKILILANAPHPDLSALKDAAESLKNNDVSTKLVSQFNDDVSKYDLVVFHNLPSAKNPITEIVNKVNIANIATFWILGTQTQVSSFNKAQKLLTINNNNNTCNEVIPIFNNSFNTFTLEQIQSQVLENSPALFSPYGLYNLHPTAKNLLTQKIGSVNSNYPLLSFMSESNGNKTGVLAGENIWRWRMYEYMKNRNQNTTNQLITKCISYLTVKRNKKPFSVRISKNQFLINEVPHFDADIYNNSMELVNTSTVTLQLTDENANTTSYTFNKNASSYFLDIPKLPSGNYSYQATTSFNGNNYSNSGSFNISDIALEAMQTTADHNLMYQLAAQSGGSMFYANQLQQLSDSLLNNTKIKPALYSQYTSSSILNIKWILALLILILSLEWIIRKWLGGF